MWKHETSPEATAEGIVSSLLSSSIFKKGFYIVDKIYFFHVLFHQILLGKSDVAGWGAFLKVSKHLNVFAISNCSLLCLYVI